MRDTEARKDTSEDAWAVRLCGAALGLLGGGCLGLLLAAAITVWVRPESSCFPELVFGGAGIGALVGCVYASAGFNLAEGAAHFVVGLFIGIAERIVNPLPESPLWLKSMYWLGLVMGMLFAARLYW